MVFKLVRIDTAEPHKIPLSNGIHLIGRGNFLGCQDKRVSRSHGELEVTDDSVTIKALHLNPCFIEKKSSKNVQTLKLHCKDDLFNGDRFGLLPNMYWYELLYYTVPGASVKTSENIDNQQGVSEDNGNKGEKQLNDCSENTIPNNDSQPINFDMNDTIEDKERSESPSLLLTENQEANTQENVVDDGSIKEQNVDGSVKELNAVEDSVKEQNIVDGSVKEQNVLDDGSVEESPVCDQLKEPVTPKRSHSPDSESEVKKVKVELDVKEEPDDTKPGPSNVQGNSSNSNEKMDEDNAATSSQAKAPNNGPPRERCMYGANCYRKNPQHKAEFCHPQDPDWGPGERGVCPWGKNCRRRNLQHWRNNDHPPGTQPPPQPGERKRAKKNRRNTLEDSQDKDLIVTGKRVRKMMQSTTWSDSETENEDPYGKDSSDEWEPTDTQDTQDTEDIFSQDYN